MIVRDIKHFKDLAALLHDKDTVISMLRIGRQTKASEITIKSKTWYIVK